MLQALELQVEQAKEDWVTGKFQNNDPNITQRMNMEMMARIDVLRGFIDMTYQDYADCFPNHQQEVTEENGE